MTTPMVPKDERDAPIELGELLGSGSFGEWQQLVACLTIFDHMLTKAQMPPAWRHLLRAAARVRQLC
jgi:hypothetical protein